MRTLRHAVLYASKTIGHVLAHGIDRTNIRELHVEGTLGSPSTLVVVFLQAQFVDPHLARLDFARNVAHTNHHGLDFAQRRVTHNAYFVVGMVFIIGSIYHII